MEEKHAQLQLETAVDTNTTTSDRLNSNRIDPDDYDNDTIIDPVNEHRDDPANNSASASAASRSKSKGHRAPKRKYSSGSSSKRATGTNADLNHRDPGTDQGDDEDRHRETIILQ